MLKQNSKIISDPYIMKQYSLILDASLKESSSIEYLKSELTKFKGIETINEARSLVYETFPKFKESDSYSYMGIKYCLKDSSDNLTLIVYFNDSIECFSF